MPYHIDQLVPVALAELLTSSGYQTQMNPDNSVAIIGTEIPGIPPRSLIMTITHGNQGYQVQSRMERYSPPLELRSVQGVLGFIDKYYDKAVRDAQWAFLCDNIRAKLSPHLERYTEILCQQLGSNWSVEYNTNGINRAGYISISCKEKPEQEYLFYLSDQPYGPSPELAMKLHTLYDITTTFDAPGQSPEITMRLHTPYDISTTIAVREAFQALWADLSHDQAVIDAIMMLWGKNQK